MKNWIKFLFPIIIILSGVFVGQKVLQNKQNEPPESAYRQSVAGVLEAAIDNLSISDAKGIINFNKLDGLWKLDGKNAEQEKINNLISVLLDKDGTNYDLISQNPNRFDELNVSSTSAKVSLKSGAAEKLLVFIGNSNYPGNFIRLAKENNVYLTSKSLDVLATTDRQIYYDKSIFSTGSNNIQRIYIDNTKEVYTLVKTDNKWKMENSNKEVDGSKINALLTSLENMKANEVIDDPAEKNNYKQKYGSVMLLTNDSKSETLVFSKGKSNFMVLRISDGQLFTMTKTTLDNILKPSKDLIK